MFVYAIFGSANLINCVSIVPQNTHRIRNVTNTNFCQKSAFGGFQ